MEYRDYYKALGIERDASADEIKRAWRKIARKHHPDVDASPQAADRFKAAGEAYEVLKDPEKRAAYDELGANWQSGEAFRPPPDWESRDFGFTGGGYTESDPQGFSSFFEELFGRHGQGRATGGAGRKAGGGRFQAAGQDQHATLTVDLRDSFQGATRALTLQIPEFGADGTVQLRDRTLSVIIPKGIAEGQTIRLKGQGGPGLGGGPAGDLYLDIAFAPDPLYRVDGRDLTIDLPIAPWEAALGAKVKLPTPGGPVEARVPSGARPGQKLRLKGRGLPGKTPGDLYAVLSIANPPVRTEAERAAFEKLRDAFDFDPRARMGG
jgi:curved DNA-binding protein